MLGRQGYIPDSARNCVDYLMGLTKENSGIKFMPANLPGQLVKQAQLIV
jgi:hypothetical protein